MIAKASEALRHYGESNGRHKLTDAQVVQLRQMREDDTPTYCHLGRVFGVSHTQAMRICVGLSRSGAGGPIEKRTCALDVLPDYAIFDRRSTIRCCDCRSLAHPSVADPQRCARCAGSKAMFSRSTHPPAVA